MDATIRRLTESEAPDLAVFAAACFRESFQDHFPAADMERLCTVAFALPVMERLIRDGTWVAGNWLGYAALGELPCPLAELAPPCTELARLYVPRRWQGQGVADGLMGQFLAEARDRGSRSVWLQAYRGNPRALAFYGRWHFAAFHPFDLVCEGLTLPHVLLGRAL